MLLRWCSRWPHGRTLPGDGELVTDLSVQLAASGFLADALHVRPGEIIGAGKLPERLGAPIVRADPAVTVRVLPGIAKRPGRAVLRSPFAPLHR